jgi:predicted DNA repair protein MutK
VYGAVALIVKLDDIGFWLTRRPQRALRATGAAIVRAAPLLMKALSVIGTVAMFMVGGGILVHGIGPLHHLVADSPAILVLAFDIACGVIAGAVVLGGVMLARRIARRP